MVQEHHLDDEHALAQALAQDVAGRLREAIGQRGRALLAVSGGRSPVAFLQCLSREPLDWAEVSVALVDERCVPLAHPDSNTALVRQHLLQNRATAACFVPFFQDAPATRELDDAALATLQQQAEARLARLPWPLDVAVLGMGLDAHTASFFPGAPGLGEALTTPARCAWVLPDPVLNKAHHARLTLSLSTLLAARHLCLPLSGAAKHAVYAQARQAATAELPVSLLLCQARTPVAVWLSP